MSCGDPHDTDCSEVLAELWLFLDNECDHQRGELLQRHLDECGPCLEEFGLEEHLKALLARKCGGDHAPDALRHRLRQSIHEIMLRQAVLGAEVIVQQDDDGAIVEVSTTVESHAWLSTES
ncbi:MAG TPA: mycothiol system anti-sigma-R factor [Pseudonocardiaceae bacterium]|nr:mycothiol system anti-sigma-R factor [Pseudonocardiaceae bacterium]